MLEGANGLNDSAVARGRHFDAIVVGAGLSGLYVLKRLRDAGLSVRLFERADRVGGVWQWNTWPGARTDTESWYYCYSFSRELLAEWDWKERYAPQEEMRAYLEHVAERFGLYRDIQLHTNIDSVVYDESANRWEVTSGGGERFTSLFFVSAMGNLSAPYAPDVEGLDQFQGEHYIAGRWPSEGVTFERKRVGIIGNGSTGVGLIPKVAEEAQHVYVFQRTPQFVVEAQNEPLSQETRREIKARYDEIWLAAKAHAVGMPFEAPGRNVRDVSPQRAQEIFEQGWQSGGFRFLFETFDDLLSDLDANAAAREFLKGKIREIVKDPEVAELLMPHSYPLGSKRPVIGHRFYETFNRSNVTLVDISEHGLERFTATGLEVGGAEISLDVVVFATGFDAYTGPIMRVGLKGRGGLTIAEKWGDGPKTYLGLTVAGFPNFFAIGGPHSPAVNYPPGSEAQADWIVGAIEWMREHDLVYIEPRESAEADWTALTHELADETFARYGGEVGAWSLGANIPGKARAIQNFPGSLADYVDHCQAAANDFREFTFRSGARQPA